MKVPNGKINMSIKITDHPSGDKVIFNSEDHSYTMQSRPFLYLRSVTYLVSSFFPVFNTEEVSRRYSIKHGLNQEEVKRMWKQKGRRSRTLGTNVHKYIDSKLNGYKLVEPSSRFEEAIFNQADMALEDLLKQHSIIKSEYIIASPNRLLAGTIDLILLEKKTSKIKIVDWKTNEVIKTSNPYKNGPGHSYNKGLGHLSTLDNCDYNKYALQLNLYKLILLEEDYTKGQEVECLITHLRPQTYYHIQVPDMTEEAKKMTG